MLLLYICHKRTTSCVFVVGLVLWRPWVLSELKFLGGCESAAGLVKEFDSPTRLLEKQSSLFAALVREYTARSATAANL
jgi:hypothetical protein